MIPKYYEFYNPVKIIAGENSVDNLPYELDLLGVKRPLIITDKGVEGAGLIEIVKKVFDASDMEIGAIFDETPPDSSIEVVNRVSEIYKENNCDSFVAIGGGSSIDTAKGANIVVTENSNDLMKFMGAELLKKPLKPLIVIPTTAGTGSEVTLVAVISHKSEDVKMAFTSYNLLPKVAILDPRMTLTLPPKITAATGMDALVHAIEAYICLGKNPMSDSYSFTAIKLISENIVKAVEKGKDKKVRLAMANAATIAGVSFSNSMVGMVHSLGHATGGVAHVPHGVAMNIFLPFGLRYNMPKVKEYIGELLLPLAGAEVYANTPADDRADKVVDFIEELQKKLEKLSGLPRTLKDAGVKKEQFQEIAEHAINDGSLTYNPVEMELKDALKILEEAYE